MYNLDLETSINGGYFSSEQIDLLSIIQCGTTEELINFINNCDQINHLKDIKNIITKTKEEELDSSKKEVFQIYQNTMVYHDQSKKDSRLKRFEYLGLKSKDDILSVIEGKYPNSEEIIELNHHYVSEERDQLKSEDLYEELEILNSQLPQFNSMLIGSGKIYNVVNKYSKEKKFDFYHAKRDLDFAYRNGKQVRFHSLLVKDDSGIFDGKSKEQVMNTIKEYVKESIDFINNYNENHKVIIEGKEEPVINAVDLFNEIVSFDKNEEGQYFNIWESKYKISMPELLSCFDYALEKKPKGVNYLYNEPFLEDDERRKKVLNTLSEIDTIKPGLIDTLRSQTHITITEDISKIERCYADLKRLQDMTGKKIQITEFDMSLGRTEAPRVFGPNADVTLDQVYQAKKENISKISNVIKASGVKLSGVSYWSLTDGIDCNLERLRSKELEKEPSRRISIPTACGGLIPTHKKLSNKNELNQMFNGNKKRNIGNQVTKKNQSNRNELSMMFKDVPKKRNEIIKMNNKQNNKSELNQMFQSKPKSNNQSKTRPAQKKA